jgi:phage-related protein
MYELIFYTDKSGKCSVLDYVEKLSKKNDKDSRIKFQKINDYLQAIQEGGTQIGEPYIKHLDGDIWELRPLRDRILFAAWNEKGFLLLHVFMKQTQKTPKREIDQAKRELADWTERSADDE